MDIEVANPLGANSGVHKLTMYYFSILNLPPEILSNTAHIHLVAVAAAQDVKLVGHNTILSRFTQEMKELRRGLLYDGNIVTATLGVVCADNLAANGLINMCESFNADHFCRFCTLPRDDAQRCCTTPPSEILRTREVIYKVGFKTHMFF